MRQVENSRTSKSIKNSAVALFFYLINLILQFYSRRIFLDCLGTEVLGLNTTATNLLQFLNLAEMGIGAAVSFTLYKPIYEKDQTSICEIVSLQGYIYRRIAFVVIFGATILICFFPVIFKKMELPLWYAYASFGVLLFSSLLGYFYNYKQILLSASQLDYKIQYSYKSVVLAKTFCQIFVISNVSNGYTWWLTLEFIFAIAASLSLDLMIRKTFPYLHKSSIPFNALKKKYKTFTTKIKQVFFHKIGGFALSQLSPLVIYAFTSLTVVALYGNYTIITLGVASLVSAIFNSMGAGIGNLVAEGDEKRILSVFYEIFNLRFYVVFVLCFTLYAITPQFISVWLGTKYILPQSTLMLMIAIMYVTVTRNTIDSYLFAYGMFQDIWAPIVEAVLNISISILLGYFGGLNGVLTGVLTSQIMVIIIWKPYFLFSVQFKGKLKGYCMNYLKLMAIGMLTAYGTWNMLHFLPKNTLGNVTSFITYAIITIVVYAALLFIALYSLSSEFRNGIIRVKRGK